MQNQIKKLDMSILFQILILLEKKYIIRMTRKLAPTDIIKELGIPQSHLTLIFIL